MQLFAHFHPNPAVECGRELGKKQGKPMGWCEDSLIGQKMKKIIIIIKECKARGSCSPPVDQCPASSWAAVSPSPSTLVNYHTLLFHVILHGMRHPLASLDQLSWPCHLLASLAPSVSITVGQCEKLKHPWLCALLLSSSRNIDVIISSHPTSKAQSCSSY